MANVNDKLKGLVPVLAPKPHSLKKVGTVVHQFRWNKDALWTFYVDSKGAAWTRIRGKDEEGKSWSDTWFSSRRSSSPR